MRLLVLARHGESTLNFEKRINGNPTVAVPLTEKGRSEARLLGQQLAHVPLDLCMHSRFGRTRETAQIALAGRGVPCEEDPSLDDVDIGDLEGRTLAEYRSWKSRHARADPFPGGESLDDAARRYATAFRKVLERPESTILVVTHEIPVRYAINGANGSDDLDGPVHELANATPYLFDELSLPRAAGAIVRIVGRAAVTRGEPA